MLYLVTGTPGAGKTLNTIKWINEDDRFQNRPIYYYNVKNLAFDWLELSEDDAREWYNLPDNSVIFVDEAQAIWPPRKVGSTVPKSVQEMSTLRHRGFDLILITQHPTLIDAAPRKLVETHYHYDRKFGFGSAQRFQFTRTANDPNDHFAQQEAIVKRIKYDKSYYDKYKSAEIHNEKAKIPFKVFGVGIAILSLIGGMIFFVSSVTSRWSPEETDIVNPVSSLTDITSNLVDPKTARTIQDDPFALDAEYFAQFIPRVENLEYTAPIYDDLTEVKSFPRPVCIRNDDMAYKGKQDACKCYSQQSTRLSVSQEQCNIFVERGWFDFTKSDDQIYADSSGGARESVYASRPVNTQATNGNRKRSNAILLNTRSSFD